MGVWPPGVRDDFPDIYSKLSVDDKKKFDTLYKNAASYLSKSKDDPKD